MLNKHLATLWISWPPTQKSLRCASLLTYWQWCADFVFQAFGQMNLQYLPTVGLWISLMREFVPQSIWTSAGPAILSQTWMWASKNNISALYLHFMTNYMIISLTFLVMETSKNGYIPTQQMSRWCSHFYCTFLSVSHNMCTHFIPYFVYTPVGRYREMQCASLLSVSVMSWKYWPQSFRCQLRLWPLCVSQNTDKWMPFVQLESLC